MMRRSLTQIGGQVEVWAGREAFGDSLTSALNVDADADTAMQHVHGFHSYPARMHPDTARRIIQGLSRGRQTILDPFAGSGTVLVEARLLGNCAIGIDANPLAVALARLKTAGVEDIPKELWLGVVDAIAEHADQRRCAKVGPSRAYPAHHRAAFDSHVLLELDGLLQGIELEAPAGLTSALKLVLSSMINKVSRRRSDTNVSQVERRLASGFTIHFFVKKARELVLRLEDYARRLPPGCPTARIVLGDARRLSIESGTVDAIVTSPPYPGIYDYVEHHRLRLELLGFDAKHLERHEIGAHRHFARHTEANAEANWAAQLGACLDEMRRVIQPSGKIVLLIADSAVAGRAWHADRALQELAAKHGLTIAAGASQRRQHFHAPTRDAFRASPRREHLIVLERSNRLNAPTVGGSKPARDVTQQRSMVRQPDPADSDRPVRKLESSTRQPVRAPAFARPMRGPKRGPPKTRKPKKRPK